MIISVEKVKRKNAGLLLDFTPFAGCLPQILCALPLFVGWLLFAANDALRFDPIVNRLAFVPNGTGRRSDTHEVGTVAVASPGRKSRWLYLKNGGNFRRC
jgi:hypothetical protein